MTGYARTQKFETGLLCRARVFLERHADSNQDGIAPVLRQRVDDEVDAAEIFIGDDPVPGLLIPIEDNLTVDAIRTM